MAASVSNKTKTVETPAESSASSRKAWPRRVTVLKDTKLEFPQLYIDVYLEGPPEDRAGFAEMFARTGSTKALAPDMADLVVFTGGSDVDPSLYNEKPHAKTYFDKTRDEECVALYLHCVENGIPMFGVCRGAQFLHVMNGGKLYQDVDEHQGDHGMYCLREKNFIQSVSSVHHQAVRPNLNGGMEILGNISRSTRRYASPTMYDSGKSMDIEAFFYRDTCCLGVQGHPEYRNYPAFTKWTLDTIDSLIICNPDLEFKGRFRRIKDDLIAQRRLGWGHPALVPNNVEVN